MPGGDAVNGLSEPDALSPDALGPDALWDVSRSALGRRWRLRPAPLDAVQRLAAGHGLAEPLARLLVARDLADQDIETYLAPTLRRLLPDPSTLADMDRAAERLAVAVEQSEPLAVFADYDVDGATSAALLLRYLRALGREARLYVPDRQAEGYGPNGPALERLAAEGASLVVTVDCGVTAFDALDAAAAAGLDIVVIDHHQADDALPVATAVVNPNRRDDASGLGTLAAVGVVFLTLVALTRVLRARGWFSKAGVPEPNLLGWLDLVALGTVCDVVPLQGLNRALVVQGLKVMGQGTAAGHLGIGGSAPGLAALGQVAGLSEQPGPYHLGFLLGPRVNAGGRVGRADLGARLLATDDAADAEDLARQLDALNRERRDIEQAVLDAALVAGEAQIEAWPERPLVCVSGEGWHPGVIGIVASRLKDRLERPALVLALENGVAKGSGRSVQGADLGAAVLVAREAGLLVNGGGHPMAAGLTVEAEHIAALDRFLCDALALDVARARAERATWIDATLSVAGASRDLYETFERAGPFGAGNAEPVIAIRGALVQWVREIGENHLRCTLASPEGARLAAVAFRCRDTALGQALRSAEGRAAHVTGRLRADNWKGRNGVQLHIEDIALDTGQTPDADPCSAEIPDF